MLIKHDELKKFKQIYHEKFNTELSDSEALDYRLNLLNFMKVVRNIKGE